MISKFRILYVFKALVTYFKLHPRLLFFIDGFGAIVSCIFLGIVLPYLISYVGMPLKVLYFLAALPIGFAIFSFSCYFLKIKQWKPYMKTISIINTMYCLLSLFFLVLHFEKLEPLGVLYFIVEICLVLFIALIEWKTSSS